MNKVFEYEDMDFLTDYYEGEKNPFYTEMI